MSDKKPIKKLSQTVRIDIPPEADSLPASHAMPEADAADALRRPADPSRTVVMLRSLVDGSRYQELLQNMYDGVLMTDQKGRVVEVNDRAAKLFNCSKTELAPLGIFDLVYGADEALLDSITDNLQAKRHVLLQAHCKRLDGTSFPSEIAVTALHVTAEGQLCFFIRDITERQRAEQALRDREQELSQTTQELESANRGLLDSEEHLRATIGQLREKEDALARERDLLQLLMDNIPDRIYFKDVQCRFLRVNRALAELVGIGEPAGATGKTDFDFFGKEQAREFFEDDQKVMRTGIPIIDKLERLRRPDGSTQWSSTTKVPLRDELEEIVGLVGISRDITARMKAEQDLKAAQSQLDRVKRLEATALFAGQIAHDFNNLLMPLLVYPDIIKKDLPEGSRSVKDVELIANAARQIADINQDLLALSRRGNVKQDVLNLNAMVEEIVESFRRGVAPDAMRIDCYPKAQLANVMGGAPQLMRVLQNLCQNAIDAMGDAGHLVVTTDTVYLDKPFGNYVTVNPGEYVRVAVADDGPGIPDEVKDKIFDPFFTTKTTKKKRGSGLGLSVVYGIVTDHKGYVDMVTQVGKGTTFSLYFPVCRDEIKQEIEGEIPSGQESILVVDDDPIQIEVFTRILSRLGYSVEGAQSGEEAVDLFAKRAAARKPFPDLVILDMIMGAGMDGTETFQRLRDIRPEQRALIVSGYKESDRVTVAQGLGAGRYLRKPVTLEGIARAVRAELDTEL
ncbi:MAG: PAS domain S-box protein [Kiritimatiellae bacterium]|nr:PAS domain S-box protein [Kiritimatiellia bacterium]